MPKGHVQFDRINIIAQGSVQRFFEIKVAGEPVLLLRKAKLEVVIAVVVAAEKATDVDDIANLRRIDRGEGTMAERPILKLPDLFHDSCWNLRK